MGKISQWMNALRFYLLLYGSICYFMVLSATLWFYLLLYGSICYFMVLSATLYNNIKSPFVLIPRDSN